MNGFSGVFNIPECCERCGTVFGSSGHVACKKCGRVVCVYCWVYDRDEKRFYCKDCWAEKMKQKNNGKEDGKQKKR